MGAMRNFGYFINIVWILVCLVAPYGIYFILLPIIFIIILRRWAINERRHNEMLNSGKNSEQYLKDLRDLAYSINKKETRVMSDSDYKKYLENKENWK